MKIEPYGKHQLYIGNYEVLKGGKIKVPDKCYWVVRTYQGDCDFADTDEPGEIALILNEDYLGGSSGFWSVISFLTACEVGALGKQLLAAKNPR